ncbi:MAG: aminotransferase class I/II-fold pyridoxal phosphate-dependent enzyme ['Candidatus Kapabacteria' thiocyanatum]|uniref:Methionine aminotransferase n=1 Tax=Candidatus Kapaibacterium thiocyanatum TaxID=1895771 RepID=A0A1M3KVX8_9BACT|nr:aminotransferase class I/II-fold pyridoxal phosphate-dependent enzyme ['Candidatus Kapabacteria' thiocyanatum]OJX56376.1 MAG: methionine aminotransferase ['Candidatus Kapabacteria' thiocyanatum]
MRSKLPAVGTTVFSVMTGLAQEHGAINLAQGFPDYACDPVLVDFVGQALRDGYNQYAPMQGVLAFREAIARKYAVMHDVTVDPATELTITPGATAALFTAVTTVVRPGDDVVIFEPAYDSYGPAVVANGGRVLPILLKAPHYRPDMDELRAMITPATSMIIINSPHNPTGTTWSDGDLCALADVVDGTDIVILSDEVYDHIVFDGQRHHSAASIDGLRERSFVVTSFGKTFHTTGWKIGCCLAPPALTNEFRKVHQFLSFSVHTPTQVALARYMQDETTYTQVGTFFQHKRDLFRSLLEGSAWSILPCTGSYFQLLGYDGFSREGDMDLAVRLTKDIGVASIPLSPFISVNDGQPSAALRFCIAKEDATLERAAERLRQVAGIASET